MKKTFLTLAAVLTSMATGWAQTLNVVSGNVTTQFPAEQTGTMAYADNGATLTICGKSFSTSDIERIYTDDSPVTDNTVGITYDGTSAQVVIAGNIAQYLTTAVSGGHVCIIQSEDVTEEITYTLSGSSSNGSFYMNGKLKTTIVLNGLTLHNPDSAAINIRDGKRINVILTDGTTSTLTDGTGGSQKACFAVKGHTEFDGTGTLNLTGNTAHAFWGKEYVQLKKGAGNINVLGAVGDGFNVNQYYQQNGGTVNISGVGDDGIQVSYKTDDDDNIEVDDENTGEVLIKGGTLKVTVTAKGVKGIKAEGNITINESKGTTDISVTNTGDGHSRGGGGGWGPGGGGSLSGDNPKAIKAKGDLTIEAGTVYAYSKNHEALEAKGAMTISGGTVYAEGGDDAINSGGDMTITGGNIYAYSTSNDGLDANGNMYVQGGVAVAFGGSGAETGIDIDERHKLYISGGELFGIGGRIDSSFGTCTQAYGTASSSTTSTSYFVLSDSSDNRIFAVKAPTASYRGTVLVSSASMSKYSKYTISSGSNVSGTEVNGYIASPTVGSVNNAKSFTAK